MQPYILTILMDEHSFERLNCERKNYFPAERNIVPAHISLFHKLPQEEKKYLLTILHNIILHTKAFNIEAIGLKFLGGGVAYKLRSPELEAVHRELKTVFNPWLSPQDQQPFQPHITIQNKVTSDVAKNTQKKLESTFKPFSVKANGLQLWEYQTDGTWRLEQQLLFSSEKRL